MPRPLLPDSLAGVLSEHDSALNRLGSGSGLLELGDPSGPPVVQNLGLSSTVQRDSSGRDRAEVLAGWDPIVLPSGETADPQQAGIRDYHVGYSINGGLTWSGDAATEATQATISNLPIGKRIDVRVRARTTAGVFGPYTSAFILAAKDTTAPLTPTAPALTGVLHGVRATWDGKSIDGNGPADDTRIVRVYIHASTTTVLTEDAFVGEMGVGERTYTHPLRDYKTTVYAAFRLVDRTGNRSAFSAVSNGAKPEQAVSDDLIENIAIEGRAAGTFGGGNGVTNSSFEARGQTGTDSAGNATATDDPWWSWTRVGTTYTGKTKPFHRGTHAGITRSGGSVSYVESARIPIADPGPKVVSAWVRLQTAGLTPRVQLFNPGGTQPTEAPPADQHDEAQLDPQKVGVWQRISLQYASTVVGPSDGTQDHVVRVLLDSGPNGSVDVDAVQYELGEYLSAYAPAPDELLPGSIGPTQISPNSVTTEKLIAGSIVANRIQADQIGANHIVARQITAQRAHLEDAVVVRAAIRDLAVDNAKIGDATITSLKVAEITAERITTGTLRASTKIIAGDTFGSRVELDYDGLRLITRRNGFDEVTVALDRATGTGRFQGEIRASTITGSTLRTGDTGNYIVLSDLTQRDKIQFVRGDQGQYVAGTVTSVFAGLVLDGSSPTGGAGRIVLGSDNGDQIIAFARRLVRSDTHVRAGQVAVAIAAGGTDVAWPGGAFQNGVIPDAISVMVVHPTTAHNVVSLEIGNISQSGFRVWAGLNGAHVDASRTLQIYAEAVLYG